MNQTMFLVKRMLPEYIFDTAKLEDNPMTYPEVKTLIDGITVGGHKVSDEQQILNLKEAWEKAFKYAKKDILIIDKKLFCDIHASVARKEAMEWGTFRTGNVGIGGTTNYTCPDPDKLDDIFFRGINNIPAKVPEAEDVINLFLWAAYNQFFWDGNKRTARIVANIVLMRADAGVFNIKVKDILEFNTLMPAFYDNGLNSKEYEAAKKFLLTKCIHHI